MPEPVQETLFEEDKKFPMEYAYELAESFQGIPGFKWTPPVIKAAAELMFDWCQGALVDDEWWEPRRQAEWLAAKAQQEWTEWQGYANLKKLFLSKFRPAPANVIVEFAPPPKVDCSTCKDKGIVYLDADPADPKKLGSFVRWCDCSAATTQREADPQLVDFRNNFERETLRIPNTCRRPPLSKFGFPGNRTPSASKGRRKKPKLF